MGSLDAAVMLLDRDAKHWTLSTENSAERGRHYSCTVWAFGKRFSVQRATPLAAVEAAIAQMSGRGKKGLKLA